MDALLPTLIIFFSLVGLVFIFFQKTPEKNGIENEVLDELNKTKGISKQKKKFLRWIKKIKKTPLREIFFNFWEKFLRRLRIIILRLDKSIADKLLQLKKGKFLKEENKKLKPILSKKLVKNYLDEGSIKELNKLNFDNLDLKEEEQRLLKELMKNFEDTNLFKNLARLYLWEKDYHSACWALLQVYYLNTSDKIIYDLLLEIKEKCEDDENKEQKELEKAEVAQR